MRDINNRSVANKLLAKIPQKWEKIIRDDNLICHYVLDCNWFMKIVKYAKDDILSLYDDVIFESGQGLLLDQNIKGYGEHTTPSNTGIKNAAEIIENILPSDKVEACYVTRTYMTRHGVGRFDSECSVEEINPRIYDKTNTPNPHQGEIRYGTLDYNSLFDRILADFGDNERFKLTIAFTHTDELDIRWQEAVLPKRFDGMYISNGETRNEVFIPNI